ncbi:hypothetical protein BRC81_06860 [Halobacteriales archaeon QS_1_68_20]|nr:MAG: hypothetical protein BRC81_06860 [Halobacteriales archaeon QS_1_68_20]
MARRAVGHRLVSAWAFQSDAMSPRRLQLRLDATQYPEPVRAAKLDARWFEDGDYSIHYLERRDDGTWQCHWDRHPKPGTEPVHFHPSPSASGDVDPSEIDANPHLGILFEVLDRIEERVTTLYEK